MTLAGALNETYVDMVGAGIVDPVKAGECAQRRGPGPGRFALQNAASIAGMVLPQTGETLIVEKPQKKQPAGGGGYDDHMDY